MSDPTQDAGFMLGLVAGVIITIAIVFVIPLLWQSPAQYPAAITFTVIDHDIADHSIYTSDGEILTTNKYQWKLLELNKTYTCDKPFAQFSGILNCKEMYSGVSP